MAKRFWGFWNHHRHNALYIACALAAMIFWAYFRVRESRSVALPTVPETEA